MLIDSIDLQNKAGETPLHLAMKSDRSAIMEILIKKGINMEIKDNKGESVIDIAKNDTKIKHLYKLLSNYKRYKNKNVNSNPYYNSFTFFVFFSVILSLSFFLMYLVKDKGLNRHYNFILLTIGILLLILFEYISTSDPGLIKGEMLNSSWLTIIEKNNDIHGWCPYCKIRKNNLTIKHCHQCGHCISEFDHHCTWINNCISGKNQILFMFFLLNILLTMYFIIYLGFNIYKYNATQFSEKLICVILMTICLFLSFPVLYLFHTQISRRAEAHKLPN
jgi:palmitoyltransferase